MQISVCARYYREVCPLLVCPLSEGKFSMYPNLFLSLSLCIYHTEKSCGCSIIIDLGIYYVVIGFYVILLNRLS